MLKQVEIDASKIQWVKTSRNIESKNTESKIIIEVVNRKRDEVNSKPKSDKYKTRKIIWGRNPFMRLRAKIRKIKIRIKV